MTVRVAHSPETAEADLRALVRDIGPGFHPDTRGADYVNLPPRWEIRRDRIDETVAAAIDHGLDPYAIALDVLGDAIDTASSGSRQHFIDTGRYLAKGEAEAYSTHGVTCTVCGGPNDEGDEPGDCQTPDGRWLPVCSVACTETFYADEETTS